MSDKLRSVAFFAPGWPPGSVPNGIVSYVGEVRQSLELLGIETQVVTSHMAESSPPSGRMGSGTISPEAVDLSKISLSRSQRFLLRAFEKLPSVHTVGPRLGLAVAQAATKIGTQRLALLEMEETFGAAWYAQQVLDVPVVVRIHGPAFLNMMALGLPEDDYFHRIDRAERRCVARAAGVTAPSRDVLDRVRNHYQISLPAAQVIPNPAPIVAIEQRWRIEDSDPHTLLFVGRFDRHKGGDILIDAFREVAEALPDVKLIFVGPDRGLRDDAGVTYDLPGYLDARLSPEIKARVQVTGPLPAEQIEALRRRARVTVVPSRYETFCLALVESLAYGCPTVASNAGGMPEILLKDRTGLLFENADPSDLARKVITLFENPELAAELGNRAAVDIAVRLNPASVARVTLEYYQSVLNEHQRGALQRGLSKTLYKLTGGRGSASLHRNP